MLGILGAGAFGQALAITASRALQERAVLQPVWMWARRQESVDAWSQTHGTQHPSVKVTNDLAQLAQQTTALVYALPAQVMRPFFSAKACAPLKAETRPLLIASKGIEAASGLLLPQVAQDLQMPNPLAILSGPHLAKELCAPISAPTIGLIAGEAASFVGHLAHKDFLLKTTQNITGVAFAGAFKNVMALCAGVMRGENVPQNTQSALLAKGFLLMQQMSVLWGAQQETCLEPALLADYILTTGSNASRNTRAGMLLGQGQPFDGLKDQPLAEGVLTLKALQTQLQQKACGVPFVDALAQRVFKAKPLCWAQLLQDGFCLQKR
ncbi:MAG: NAD(P)H-dependent glycerol-3-phosphate dehydrogenase [Holosporaceae bacterium]